MKFAFFLFLAFFFAIVPCDAAANNAAPGDSIIELLDVRDLDVKDAVKLIAERSGINIAVGQSVQGKVTVHLENFKALEALAAVVQLADAAYEETSGLVQVITGQEYLLKYGRPFSQRLTGRLFHLKGMKASAAASLVEKIKNQFGTLVADDVSRTLYVEDTAGKLAEIDRYLKEIDRPLETRVFHPSFIEVEALAVQIGPLLTPGVGSMRVDRQSNKLFVNDLPDRFIELNKYVEEVDVERKAAVFNLSYARVEELAEVIKGQLTKDVGSMEVNKRANQIIVVDTKARIARLNELILQLDEREKEVLIEARIVQVFLKDEFRMGVDWEAVIKKAHGLRLASHWGGISSDSKFAVTIGTLADDNYKAVIEAMGRDNKAHVLSSPRVAVLNNEEAKIHVGTTRPYVTTQTTTSTVGPVTVSEEVKFIDVGVKLAVRPTIHNDGYVTMKIRPEVSSAANSIMTGQSNVIPVVDTSEVETTVRIKDGVTVLIGGLIKDEKARQRSKVPVIGDIPFLGAPFRSSARNQEKTEIVIFLTPRIITGDAP